VERERDEQCSLFILFYFIFILFVGTQKWVTTRNIAM
jgi:hypothetical protein